MTKAKLLLVEDEKNFGSVLKEYLKMNGFDVTLCEDGEQGLGAAKNSGFDLCIIDVMMPKKDGFSLSAEIKALDQQVPFLFLTARGLREDIIKGYKLGAEDYIIKPFDSEVLLLKIQAILNRRRPRPDEKDFMHQIGCFSFNARLRSLKDQHGEIKLSPKEAALLNLLCHHKNDVLPRETALKQIWKEDTYFTARSMDVYIVKLRKYLVGDSSVEINNVHGNGYSLLVRQGS